MDPNDRKDIIKKINTAGQDAGGENDDFGDTIAEPENNGGKENVDDNSGDTFGEGIQILPKDHKQVFKDAKLGVNESTDLNLDEKNSIFAENENMTETEEPLVKPKTVPIVKPNEQPKRREKPWRITPQEAPQPKANK